MAKEAKEKREFINVVTPKFRLSFPNLFEPKAVKINGKETGKPLYSLTMLFPKKTDLKGLKVAINDACIQKWGEDESKWPDDLLLPWRDGDEEENYDGYKGHIYAKADSQKQPGLVDQKREDILEKDELYAGCFCRAKVSVSAYELPSTKQRAGAAGVKFYLQSVQKMGEGERFGRSAKNDFDDVADESEDLSNYDGDDEGGVSF